MARLEKESLPLHIPTPTPTPTPTPKPTPAWPWFGAVVKGLEMERARAGPWFQGVGLVLEKKKRRAAAVRQSWPSNWSHFDRTLQFWKRSLSIYASYKVCQIQVQFLKTKEEQDKSWENQHEMAADKIYSLCSELGGFFLKVAQLVGKPDLAPDAWVRKLVTLCDAAPATPFETAKLVVEKELGSSFESLFDKFIVEPLGSASIAQVHRARLKGAANDVAVKVQHPGVEELMMMDIRNLKMFATLLQRFDLKFDLISVIDELEEQVGYEFDFVREANSMNRIYNALSTSNKGKPKVVVPRPISGMITRQVLAMEFMDGIPILQLEKEMLKRGIDANGSIAKIAKRNILRDLTDVYGHMILRDGFFHADPHPGNILINNKGKVMLIDYGQVKEIPEDLKVKFAHLVEALADGEANKICCCLEKLGVVITSKRVKDQESLKKMAIMMFDSTLPPGYAKLPAFGEESLLKKYPITNFPKELFFVLRTVHLLRGLSMGMGIDYSCCKEWRKLAKEAIFASQTTEPTLSENDQTNNKRIGTPTRELVWKTKRYKRLRWFQPTTA